MLALRGCHMCVLCEKHFDSSQWHTQSWLHRVGYSGVFPRQQLSRVANAVSRRRDGPDAVAGAAAALQRQLQRTNVEKTYLTNRQKETDKERTRGRVPADALETMCALGGCVDHLPVLVPRYTGRGPAIRDQHGLR